MILMEGDRSVYTPFVKCKVLDKTSSKVMATLPLENIIFAGTHSRRDVAFLGSEPEEAPSCIL